MRIKTWLTLAACTLLAGLPLGAQAQTEAGMPFRVASWEKIDEDLYYVPQKKEGLSDSEKKETHAKLIVHEMDPSPVYGTKRAGVVHFYRKKMVAEEVVYTVAASVKVADSSGPYIFLFFPMDEKTKKYNIYAIPDSRTDSPYGGYQFHNLTQMNIAGKLGTKEFKLSSKSRVSNVKFQYSEKTPLPFGLMTQIEGKAKWLARNTFSFNPNKHLKVFIYSKPDVNGQARVKVKGLVDFYEPQPEEVSQNP